MKTRKIWEKKAILPSQKKRKIFWIFLPIILLCFVLLFFIKPTAQYMKGMFNHAAKKTVNVVSRAIGTPMQKDQQGNVNVLLLGYGGGGHHGGYLSDAIMVASWNPELDAVSMLSIPRDFFIKNPLGGRSRINSLFTQFYNRSKDLQDAGIKTAEEIGKILNLEIPYFATVDFSGFKEVIDILGGVEIDVPEALIDDKYPNNSLGFDPLYVKEGLQHMDGELALKYARSRKSTSDFSRSLRQQLVIDAMKNKALSFGNISLDKIKNLYASYKKIVNTNISLDEMLWTVQFAEGLQSFSFGLNDRYSSAGFKNTQVGSFLYGPSREQFNGASVLLPFGANATKIDHYPQIQNYVDFLAHFQPVLLERATISINNGIEKKLLKLLGSVPLAGRIAVWFKRFWLKPIATKNSDPQALTTLLVHTESEKESWFEATIALLKKNIAIDEVVYATGVIKEALDEYGSLVQVFTGADLELTLWASFLESPLAKERKFEMIKLYE